MPAPPLKEEISAPYPNPSNAVMRSGMAKLYDYVTGLLGATGNAAEARAALGFKRGADIASAATINLSTATGDLVDVTGTTTITAITLADGEERTVRFTGSLTLTHGASLALPGAANITTAAGDFAVFRGYALGVVRCVWYTRASGLPVAGSQATETVAGMARIATQAETNAGTDNTTFITPQKMRFGVSYSIGASGYIFLPSWLGGFGIQWGQVSVATSATAQVYSFPIAWPNACRSIVAQVTGQRQNVGEANNCAAIVSTTQYSISSGMNSSPNNFFFIAIGN